MTGSGKLLIIGGISLAAVGMLYGLHYALFVEHQTLERMGGSLATAFSQAAARNWSESETQLAAYANIKFSYVRQVDAHSHWIGLAMLMIILGVLFERVNLAESVRRWLAIGLLSGSILFPLAVLLQTGNARETGSVLAVVGSALVMLALTGVAVGFFKQRT